MGRNSRNWRNADENEIRAQQWYLYCTKKFDSFIRASISKSKIYDKGDIPQIIYGDKPYDTIVIYANTDTTSAIEWIWKRSENHEKVAALNFASYKNPGGGFLVGATAQEECLCNESILYNVIEAFYDDFYKPHLKKLNGGLYGDDLIYSPEILFIRENKQMLADVITCAAPNYYPIQKYNRYPYKDVVKAMFSRIDHILYAAWEERAEVLILGAFGCGVFMNDPIIVSQIFNFFIHSKYRNCFKEVVFAIPTFGSKDNTFETFKTAGIEMVDYLNRDGKLDKKPVPELIKYMM